jgi:nitroreductase
MSVTEAGEDALHCDFEAFAKVVRTRRSVRAYLPDPIPDAVLDRCLDLALLAPNSQNLEPWQFIEVRDPAKRETLGRYCLNQPQAVQAPHLIVAVARPDFWRMGRRLAMEALDRDATRDPLIAKYHDALIFKYRVLVPLMFADGPFHLLAPLKRLILWAIGLFEIFWRFDTGAAGQTLWATKTTALACQNLMLALRAAGYDSCAMEGFDEPRTKRLLGLPRPAHIVMVIAAGKRAEGGVAPLYRFDRKLYIQRV